MVTTKVQVYIYELTGGMARALSRSLIGIEVEGVWHTGIVAYNREYFFGSDGISSVAPGGVIGQPTEIVDIGESEIPLEVFEEFLIELAGDRFDGRKYHLLEHNCNNFSNEVAQFLTGNSIPAKIVNLPSEVMSTPFGQMIRPFIESMMSPVNGVSRHFQPHGEPSAASSAQAPTHPPPSTDSSSGQTAGGSSQTKPTSQSKSDAASSKSSHHDFDLD